MRPIGLNMLRPRSACHLQPYILESILNKNNVSNVLSFSLFYLSPFLCFTLLCVHVFLFSCLIILVSLSTHLCNAVLTFLLRPRNDFSLFTWTDKRKACIWIFAPIGHSLSVLMIITWPVRQGTVEWPAFAIYFVFCPRKSLSGSASWNKDSTDTQDDLSMYVFCFVKKNYSWKQWNIGRSFMIN